MSEPERYFAESTPRSEAAGTWVRWADLVPLELAPGLAFRPVVAEGLMVSFVAFEPHTAAPLHWHEEEQVSYVVEGELEFEVAGETRLLRPGDAVVIPPNVPHGARTYDRACLEVDVFHPPRRGMLDALERARAGDPPAG